MLGRVARRLGRLSDGMGLHQQRAQIEPKGPHNVPCPVPCRIAFAIRAVVTRNQPRMHQRRQMATQGAFGHAVRPLAQGAIGREHHQPVIVRQAGTLMKAEQGIQHRQIAIRHTKRHPRGAHFAKQRPLVRMRHRSRPLPGNGTFHQRSRHRPLPKGRRC